MTFVNACTLGTISGQRDELVAILTQHNDLLREIGCSVYEVGINADAPDTVFVVEVWDSQEAHRRSLEHLEVQASIAAARPILSGEFGGFRFAVIGSPRSVAVAQWSPEQWLTAPRNTGSRQPQYLGVN